MLRDLFKADKQPLPNKFTEAFGERIRRAREQAGMSQAELANAIYRRQASISDMENGKMDANITTLLMLSFVLKKPLSYFFPEGWISDLPPEKLSLDQQELLIQASRLDDDDIQRLIAQARALADLADQESLEKRYRENQNKMQQ
jgi:transcriptional regulator with XRE-family HTH domain